MHNIYLTPVKTTTNKIIEDATHQNITVSSSKILNYLENTNSQDTINNLKLKNLEINY